MGIIIIVENFIRFLVVKNFEDRLAFDKGKAKIKVGRF